MKAHWGKIGPSPAQPILADPGSKNSHPSCSIPDTYCRGWTSDQQGLGRQIAATNRQIDRLVYDLYDLTEEEIAIVEGEG